MRGLRLSPFVSLVLVAACGEAFVAGDGGGTTGAGAGTQTGTGGAATGTTATSSSGGAGGQVTGADCVIASDCPPPANPCTVARCEESVCVYAAPDHTLDCDDGDPCTTGDTCAGGVCAGSSVGCATGDGCCPSVCDAQLDADCACGDLANLAVHATASSSPGSGVDPYPASLANDGKLEGSCQFTWINGSDVIKDGWLELAWPAPITVRSVFVDTVSDGGGACGIDDGRGLLGATLEAWDDIAGAWVAMGELQVPVGGDLALSLTTPTLTKRLRLDHLVFGAAGSPIVFEWRVFASPGCT